MASSNRHWPSMFKSKPCNQWQHDINSPLICQKPPFTAEERSPEPKPRWNPKPEQIRILEAIFNSGMVNPPREEIRRIRAQLQEYGQVGDANVFYWFQNRKSRSKHKHKQLHQSSAKPATPSPPTVPNQNYQPTPQSSQTPNSSSSSSEKSEASPVQLGSIKPGATVNVMEGLNAANSPTCSVNQVAYLGSQPEPSPLFFQTESGCEMSAFSELANMLQQQEKMKMGHIAMNDILNGVGEGTANSNGCSGGGGRVTVFINEMAFEVGAGGRVNVRDAFGEAMLIHSSGHPVPTNEWGFTLQPLQHGHFYYLV
ncbi:hypothetical protein AMTRI_Chr01g133290 [Amborella trichopoda]